MVNWLLTVYTEYKISVRNRYLLLFAELTSVTSHVQQCMLSRQQNTVGRNNIRAVEILHVSETPKT